LSDIAHQQRDALPSGRQLLKLTAIAVAVAAVVLVTTVLPAEYGIDPTGIGRLLGLKSMSAAPAANPAPASGLSLTLPGAGSGAVWRAQQPYRSDELSLTLNPEEGAEIKARVQQGGRFVFTWVAEGGAVNFDMHGEKFDAPSGEFTSYWKGRDASTGHGEFTAPFPGTHGWYWRNRGGVPVTIKVRTAGFYEKLYRPEISIAPTPQRGDSK
jgi:hypothetical protein